MVALKVKRAARNWGTGFDAVWDLLKSTVSTQVTGILNLWANKSLLVIKFGGLGSGATSSGGKLVEIWGEALRTAFYSF